MTAAIWIVKYAGAIRVWTVSNQESDSTMSDSVLEALLTQKTTDFLRQELENILRWRIEVRDQNIRKALEHLKAAEYEQARIVLQTFA